MTTRQIILNISVNLGRLARWVDEGKTSRTKVFIKETEDYLKQLEKTEKNADFEKILARFKISFENLKKSLKYDKDWAEEALTWANILQHRAKLA